MEYPLYDRSGFPRGVRRRYESGVNFHNIFTLTHRPRPGLRTDRLRMETENWGRYILRTMHHDMLRHAEQWKRDASRTEKQRIEADKRLKRQHDLVFANISVQINRIKRELSALSSRERELREESAFTKGNAAAFADRGVKRLLEEHTELSDVKMRGEINGAAKRAVRNALRQMREEQEYERRRG